MKASRLTLAPEATRPVGRAARVLPESRGQATRPVGRAAKEPPESRTTCSHAGLKAPAIGDLDGATQYYVASKDTSFTRVGTSISMDRTFTMESSKAHKLPESPSRRPFLHERK